MNDHIHVLKLWSDHNFDFNSGVRSCILFFNEAVKKCGSLEEVEAWFKLLKEVLDNE